MRDDMKEEEKKGLNSLIREMKRENEERIIKW